MTTLDELARIVAHIKPQCSVDIGRAPVGWFAHCPVHHDSGRTLPFVDKAAAVDWAITHLQENRP